MPEAQEAVTVPPPPAHRVTLKHPMYSLSMQQPETQTRQRCSGDNPSAPALQLHRQRSHTSHLSALWADTQDANFMTDIHPRVQRMNTTLCATAQLPVLYSHTIAMVAGARREEHSDYRNVCISTALNAEY